MSTIEKSETTVPLHEKPKEIKKLVFRVINSEKELESLMAEDIIGVRSNVEKLRTYISLKGSRTVKVHFRHEDKDRQMQTHQYLEHLMSYQNDFVPPAVAVPVNPESDPAPEKSSESERTPDVLLSTDVSPATPE